MDMGGICDTHTGRGGYVDQRKPEDYMEPFPDSGWVSAYYVRYLRCVATVLEVIAYGIFKPGYFCSTPHI